MKDSLWKHPKVLCILLLVFLCGAAAGALAFRVSYRATPVKAWREGAREISLQRFRKELNLTEEQSQEVESVLDDFMKYYQTLQAQMDDVRGDGKERILRILKPEQRERFTRMLSDFQAKQQIR